METAPFQIQMLGKLSIQYDGHTVSDSDNRSRKVWLLLAYMVCCRNRTISNGELTGLLWSEDDDSSSNPSNALKTTLHRMRAVLDQLGDRAGHRCILRQNGSYAWNPALAVDLDIDRFEALCRAGDATEDEDGKLAALTGALRCYEGDFLPKLGTEPWVMPISAYYHNLYLQTAEKALTLLEVQSRYDDIVELARRAVATEPSDESLNQFYLRALIQLGEQREAVKAYESLRELLLTDFGILPSDETTAIYREALRASGNRTLSSDQLQSQLQEESDSKSGALLCDYDFFKVLYQAMARSVARSGDAVHIVLLSVSAGQDKALSRRSLDRCMENLQELIQTNLRKGDVMSKCSASQYILMLPQANYENSCMVMDRMVRTYARKYPHSPARLAYSVQALTPTP